MADEPNDPPDGGADPNTPRELHKARADAKRYREEADRLRADLDATAKEANGLRGKVTQTTKERDDAAAEHARLMTEREAKLTADLTEARSSADKRVIAAELRALAAKAGAVNPADMVKLLDTSALTITPDGDVKGAAELVEQAKKDRAYLFGAAGVSSNPTAPPKPDDPSAVKKFGDMTPAEQAAWKREHRLR